MADEAPALEYREVSFAYTDAGDGSVAGEALRGVSLAVARGERVALAGANGAGKTTLLLLATGLILPASGSVRVCGLEVSRGTLRAVRRRVAYLFADPDDQLFCPTALDEVAFAPRRRGEPEEKCAGRARELLAAVGLSDRAGRNPLSLSLGEKKRLALAAALAADADALLLDEPTSGLDPRARRQLLALLAGLPQAIVFATHDLDAALALASRVVVLDGGRVAADGPAGDVLRDRALLERHGLELPLSLQGVAADVPTSS